MKYSAKCTLLALCLLLLIVAMLLFYYDDKELMLLKQQNKFITFYWTKRWGIGNEMFALASTIGINSMLNTSRIVCLNGKAKIRKLFDLKQFPVCSAEFLINRMGASIYREVNYAMFDPKVKHIPQDINVVLDRFFQSWKYFRMVNMEIRQLFKMPDDLIITANNALMDEVKTLTTCFGPKCSFDTSTLRIGVHVRRKYLDKEHLVKIGYTKAPRDYFERAFKHFKILFSKQNLIFVICSDDIDWSEKHLKDLDRNVVFIKSGDPMVDLAVLASCDHSIISVGTFGWWGAWLANGTTVYYKDWPINGSTLFRSTSHIDYFLKQWIPI